MFISCKPPCKRSFKAFKNKAEACKWIAGTKFVVINFVFAHDRCIVNYFQRQA